MIVVFHRNIASKERLIKEISSRDNLILCPRHIRINFSLNLVFGERK